MQTTRLPDPVTVLAPDGSQIREDLRFVIVTMPPWPGAEEARRVEDHWPTI